MVELNLQTPNENETEWLKMGALYGESRESGEHIRFTFTRLVRNEERGCTTMLNETHGLTLWDENHPESEYPKKTPDGIRLLKALARMMELEGALDSQDVCDGFQARLVESPHTLTVEKTERGWLFSVVRA